MVGDVSGADPPPASKSITSSTAVVNVEDSTATIATIVPTRGSLPLAAISSIVSSSTSGVE